MRQIEASILLLSHLKLLDVHTPLALIDELYYVALHLPTDVLEFR
jgi:hypothetical protein